LKIYLSRFLSTEPSENLLRLEDEAKEAYRKKCSIVVFPELFLTGYKGKIDSKEARKTFRETSKKYSKIVFVFGTISEGRKNRTTIWQSGKEILFYDKINLFRPNGEDRMWESGKEYKSIKTDYCKLGVIICNDLRFSEGPRKLRMSDKIDLLVVPAFWPLRRDHIWKNLLKARAIENAIYVAGCCISHLETKKERFYGALNYVFDPLGNGVQTDDDKTYKIEIPFRKRILVDPLTLRD